MEKRLTNAYDHMTMPDSCARRIAEKLRQEQERKQAGGYTRIIFPESGRDSGRFPAVTAVCLLLALIVCLPLVLRQTSSRVPESTTAAAQYAAVTDIPAEEVENFARIVRHNILEENWEALRSKVSLPVTVQETKVTEWGYFVEWMDILAGNPLLTDRMEQESCQAMFCNWQGISMARGLIWLGEVNGELKITAVNVEIQEEPQQPQTGKQVPEVFAEVLSGDRIKMAGIVNKLPIEEYCEDWRAGMLLDAFAVVDMDSDGICELVIALTDEQGERAGYLVLREDGGEVCAYSFRAAELRELKKDGSFFWRDGEYRAYFDGKTHWHTEGIRDQQERSPAQWHSWPCRSPELLLKSYAHVTGTGWSVFPGNAHSLFEGLAMEQTGNAMEELEYWKKTGIWCQEGDRVYVFDPDAPGTAFYGTLTDENGFGQFSSVGYYISAEDREYQGEIRDLLSQTPEYWVDVHLPSFMGTYGQMVSTPEELVAYFGYTAMPDEATMKQSRELKAFIRELTLAYMEGGSEAMEPYLAETYQNRQKKFFPKDAEIVLMTYSAAPDQVLEAGEKHRTGAGVRLAGDEKIYVFALELVKEEDGWKVEGYYLNIPEE